MAQLESIELSLQDATVLIDEGAILLDVRTPEEHSEIHPSGCISLPWSFYDENGWRYNPQFLSAVFQQSTQDKPLLLICRSGKRSLQAATYLREAGFTKSYSIIGGTHGHRGLFGAKYPGWIATGLATAGESAASETAIVER